MGAITNILNPNLTALNLPPLSQVQRVFLLNTCSKTRELHSDGVHLVDEEDDKN